MSVWYLELDDEITDAVARLRAAKDERVVFVVPAGSRIGTGRINFRLLAKEAVSRDLRIALVSGDPQVRALAASAGLPVYASVGESERGAASEGPLKLDADGTPPAGDAEATGSTATITTAPGPGAGVRTATSKVVEAPRSRRRRVAMTAGVVAVVGVVGGGALWAAYQSYPTARIQLALAARAFGPERVTIRVTPSEPTSVETGTVQGQLQPTTVIGSVVVTATEPVNLSQKARGIVTFTNGSDASVPIPEETRVSTVDGIAFLTQSALEGVPAHGSQDVEVRAVEQGDQGNVPAGMITVIPDAGLAAQLGEGGGASNAAPTVDGRTAQTTRFNQADYDAAVAALREQLSTELQSAVPQVGADTIAYAGTAQPTGDIHVDQDPTTIVGSSGPETTITGSLEGNVLTASVEQLDDVARQMLATLASPDTLGPDATIDLGHPAVEDGQATYDATAGGVVWGLPVKDDWLKDQVRSKTIAEAQDILSHYGTATITLSPDFLPTLPDDPNRIELRTGPPAPGVTPIPMTSPTTSPAPSTSPTTGPSPLASGAGEAPIA